MLQLFIVLSSVADFHHFYVPSAGLLPGQTRYSSKAVWSKIEKYLERGDAHWDTQQNRYSGRFYQGNSIMALENALPVISGPEGLVLVDGHHDMLASNYFGMPFVPVFVVDDLSNLTTNTFWPEAEKRGWVYLNTLVKTNNGTFVERVSRPPATFSKLIDDPMRDFAAKTARKFHKLDGSDYYGHECPLWVKIGKDIPFIEFYLADVLYKNGFVYTYADMVGENIPKELIEQARVILSENYFPGLKLLPKKHSCTPI